MRALIRHSPAILLLLALPLRAQITTAAPMPSVVTVRVAATGSQTVPPQIFGTFLEPIGNSINNGILAEVLVNGSLESGLWNHTNLEALFRDQPNLIDSTNSTGIPLPWFPLSTAAGNRYELHTGHAANSWQSLELLGIPGRQVGIAQKISLPVQRVLTYHASLYAKHISGPATLTLLIRDHDSGAVLAHSTITLTSPSWKKYSTTLTFPAAVHPLQAFDFAVAVTADEVAELDQLSLSPTDAIGPFDPDAIAYARALHSTVLRFGGNFTSTYHWRDGIGPVDKRPVYENTAWGIPEYNRLGTDEFLQLCTLLHAQPQIALNLGSGTPAEAAAWVRYIHARYHSPVIYELGNELYGSWQLGYKSVDQIAAVTLAFSRAVRAADPTARLIATGLGPIANPAWNAQLLTLPPSTFDLLSLHFILNTNRPALPNASPDFAAAAAYALPFAVGPYFDQTRQQLDAHPDLRNRVHLAVTEWLFNSRGFGERNFTNDSPSWKNEGGAVLAAGFLNTLLRRPGSITLADMTGLMEFAGIWKRRETVYAVPAYYVFQMYSSLAGATLLPVTTDSGSYNVSGGVPPLQQMRNIPYLDVIAARTAVSSPGLTQSMIAEELLMFGEEIPGLHSDDSVNKRNSAGKNTSAATSGKTMAKSKMSQSKTPAASASIITIACVNRQLASPENSQSANAQPVRIDLGPLHPVGHILIEQISAANRYELNDETQPKHILPATSFLPDSDTASPITLTLLPESVTLLRIPIQ